MCCVIVYSDQLLVGLSYTVISHHNIKLCCSVEVGTWIVDSVLRFLFDIFCKISGKKQRKPKELKNKHCVECTCKSLNINFILYLEAFLSKLKGLRRTRDCFKKEYNEQLKNWVLYDKDSSAFISTFSKNLTE